MPVQIVINVPHQVDQTFLLRTIDRIIDCVKIRNQNAAKVLQKFLNHVPLSRITVEKNNVLQIGENPYESRFTDQSYLRFIRMHQRSASYAYPQLFNRLGMESREIRLESRDMRSVQIKVK